MTTTTLLPAFGKKTPSVTRSEAVKLSQPICISALARRGDARLIPAARAKDAVETIKLSAFSPLAGGQLSPLALVADDDMNIRKSLRIILEMSGFRVEEASCGTQALASLHHTPAVVLLDINMPGLNGIACLQEIHKRCPEMKVILVSGQVDVDASSTLANGAFQYIPKPFDIHKLIATVRSATESYSCAA